MSNSKDDIALGLLALTHAKARIRPAEDELRRQARELWRKRERVPVEIAGEIVGTVGKTSPKRTARVTDEMALNEWMADRYPEHVVPFAYIEDQVKAIEVLEQHAPHLVHYRREVAPSLLRSMLQVAEGMGAVSGPGGEADVPGISVEQPDGVVSVLIDKQQAYLVEQLFTSGLVSLDGTVRKEIEA